MPVTQRQDLEGSVCRAYRRVSSDEQARHGYSLAAQQERLEQFAQSQGWRIIQHYEDDGYSARSMDRPALRQMLADAQPGEIILVHKLDRLTRSVLDLYELLHTFDQKGLLFKSATEEFNTTTANGRLMITLVAVIAQWERETISDRAAEGIRRKASQGEWSGGPIPFGYEASEWWLNGKKQIKRGRTLLQLRQHPELAHIVAEMYHRYLSGQGVRSICNWLNETKRVPTANGNRWQPTSVARVLTNPLYCGEIVHGRRSLRKEAAVTVRRAVNVEPIVPKETWDQVQSLFAARKGIPPRLVARDWPLAGVARCGICGDALTLGPATRANRRYYRCLGYVKARCGGKGPGQSLTSVPAHVVERQVVDLLDRLRQPSELGRFIRQVEAEVRQQGNTAAPERKRLETEIARSERAIRRWKQPFEAGEITWAEYKRQTAPHEERIAALHAQVTDLGTTPPPSLPDERAPVQADIPLAWAHLTGAERKAMLLQFVAAFGLRLLVYPGGRVAFLPES